LESLEENKFPIYCIRVLNSKIYEKIVILNRLLLMNYKIRGIELMLEEILVSYLTRKNKIFKRQLHENSLSSKT